MSKVNPERKARLDAMLLDYAHTIDDQDVDRWPGYFTEDARYQITTRANYEANLPIGIMLCTSRAMMADRMLALNTANIFEPHTHCHILGPASYKENADGSIAARSNFTVIRTMQSGLSEVFAVGKYVDQIRFEDDGPLFAERIVVLESSRVEILIVYPI